MIVGNYARDNSQKWYSTSYLWNYDDELTDDEIEELENEVVKLFDLNGENDADEMILDWIWESEGYYYRDCLEDFDDDEEVTDIYVCEKCIKTARAGNKPRLIYSDDVLYCTHEIPFGIQDCCAEADLEDARFDDVVLSTGKIVKCVSDYHRGDYIVLEIVLPPSPEQQALINWLRESRFQRIAIIKPLFEGEDPDTDLDVFEVVDHEGFVCKPDATYNPARRKFFIRGVVQQCPPPVVR